MEGSKSLQREDGVEEPSSTGIPYIFTTLRNRTASSCIALSEAISQHDPTSTALYTTSSCLVLLTNDLLRCTLFITSNSKTFKPISPASYDSLWPMTYQNLPQSSCGSRLEQLRDQHRRVFLPRIIVLPSTIPLIILLLTQRNPTNLRQQERHKHRTNSTQSHRRCFASSSHS